MKRQRSLTDRRSGCDRRKGYDLAVISELGAERRKDERRNLPEKRKDWARTTQWSSNVLFY